RNEERGTRNEERGTRNEGRGTRDEERGTRNEGRGTREEWEAIVGTMNRNGSYSRGGKYELRSTNYEVRIGARYWKCEPGWRTHQCGEGGRSTKRNNCSAECEAELRRSSIRIAPGKAAEGRRNPGLRNGGG